MTKIEWTEKTWNPIIGCSKVSEGCKNCYAEIMSNRLASMGIGGYDEIITNGRFNGKVIYRFTKVPKAKMVFVNSMSDFFHKNVSYEIMTELLGIMKHYPEQIFQILTKRIENAKMFFDKTKYKLSNNIWIGTSVESEEYLYRIDILKSISQIKIKFISFEPLLEDIGNIDLSGIDWVIVGGESGHKRRPFNPDWARNIMKQCREQKVSFFMKQIDKIIPVPDDLMVREYPVIKN